MNKTLVFLVVLAALVLALVALTLAPVPAQASGPVCPAPGTGLAGAKNMILDPTMGQIMIDHTADQGDAGMFTAVTTTACP